jgi:hypothetical protein
MVTSIFIDFQLFSFLSRIIPHIISSDPCFKGSRPVYIIIYYYVCLKTIGLDSICLLVKPALVTTSIKQ